MNINYDKNGLITAIFVLIALATIFFCLGGYTGQTIQMHQQEKVVEEKIKEVYVAGEELDEWTILTMAIMKTESEFDPSRIGATQDVGIMQFTPIAVEEVNRILRLEGKEDEYSHLDAFDIRKTIEMFNIIQNYHNKEQNISKAIHQHNPGGASIGYGKKVYDNIRFIKRLEEARQELIKFRIENKLKKDGTREGN